MVYCPFLLLSISLRLKKDAKKEIQKFNKGKNHLLVGI